jgi:hypothetical protein
VRRPSSSTRRFGEERTEVGERAASQPRRQLFLATPTPVTEAAGIRKTMPGPATAAVSSKPQPVEHDKVASQPKRQLFAATPTPVKVANAAGIRKPMPGPATAAVSSKPQPPVGSRIELAVNKQREPDGTYGFLPVVVEEEVCISLGVSFVRATVVQRTSDEQLAQPLVFRVKVDDATATQLRDAVRRIAQIAIMVTQFTDSRR